MTKCKRTKRFAVKSLPFHLTQIPQFYLLKVNNIASFL